MSDTFHISVNAIHVSRILLHLTTGGSRIVSLVQAIGDYSSIEENGGNYFIAQWNKQSSNENNVVVSFEGKVAKVGDTL